MGTVTRAKSGESEGLSPLGAGLYAPTHVNLHEAEVLPSESGLNVSADLVLEGGRYVVERLTTTRRPGGVPVTGEALRKIAIQDLVLVAVAGTVGPLDEQGNPVPMRYSDEEVAAIRRQGPTDSTLSKVAQLYVIGRLVGTAPAKNVAAVLGIPMPTANNWIRRAKDRGLLDG